MCVVSMGEVCVCVGGGGYEPVCVVSMGEVCVCVGGGYEPQCVW